MKTLLAIIGVFLGIIPDCDGAVCKGYLTLKAELPTIRKAAERNGIKYGSDDWYLLLAIHQAEGGRDGCEFGITHPRAWNTNLDTQAGWAAATIVRNRIRWQKAGGRGEFVQFLQRHYCPANQSGKVWLKNVQCFYEKFKKEGKD